MSLCRLSSAAAIWEPCLYCQITPYLNILCHNYFTIFFYEINDFFIFFIKRKVLTRLIFGNIT